MPVYPHRHGTRIGRVNGFLAMVLRHVDVRWEMTTKQRLACGAAILRSIDARRQRTGNRNELLALEQAIVDRELIELVTGGLCDKKREFAGDRVRKRYAPAATRDTGALYEKDLGGQTDEPDRA